MDELYEIDLTQFNLKPFYDKIVEIVSRNNGWMNFQRGVFETIEERDSCLFELEEATGIRGDEVSTFEKDARELYKALQKSFLNTNLSEKKQQALKGVFLEILKLDLHEIFKLCQISDSKLMRFKQINKYYELKNFSMTQAKYAELKRIDDKLDEIFYKEES